MTTVNYKHYNEAKQRFFERHDFDYTIHTKSMEADGTYVKTYAFYDDNAWYERMSLVTEIVTIIVHGIEVKVPVKLQKTEYWTSYGNAKFCYYERA